MNEDLRRVSREGNVRRLYELIGEDGNVLRSFEEVEFIETPLHIAADEGKIPFAMEMINLKPSFTRKLNQQGLTPIHVAAIKRDQSMLIRFLQINKDLARVKGKEGKTPLHYICEQSNGDGLLEKFLEAASAECIRDATTKNQTALHIAVEKEKEDVLRVLTRILRKTDYCREVVNLKDEDGNTALHIAAMNNQPKMIKLLLDCKADKHVTNPAGSTPLDLAEQLNCGESYRTLRCCLIQGVSTFHGKMQKQILKFMKRASSVIFHDIDNISSEDRSALLVVLGLLLTATYQACLSPPGGVWQGDSTKKDDQKIGKSVMDPLSFLYFYIPTYAVFLVTFFLTLGLLKPFPHGFRTALQVLLAFLANCFYESVSFLAPNDVSSIAIDAFSTLLFVLMMFMCLAYRVSKLSVLILLCRYSPLATGIEPLPIGGSLIIACFLFIFLYDKFWKGTIRVLGICLLYGLMVGAVLDSLFVIGFWLFFSLCRFCIKQCNERCNA